MPRYCMLWRVPFSHHRFSAHWWMFYLWKKSNIDCELVDIRKWVQSVLWCRANSRGSKNRKLPSVQYNNKSRGAVTSKQVFIVQYLLGNTVLHSRLADAVSLHSAPDPWCDWVSCVAHFQKLIRWLLDCNSSVLYLLLVISLDWSDS